MTDDYIIDKGIEVGDVVKVIGCDNNDPRDANVQKYILSFVDEMKQYIGRTFVVDEIETHYDRDIGQYEILTLDGDGVCDWSFLPSWVEPVLRDEKTTSLTDDDFQSVFS